MMQTSRLAAIGAVLVLGAHAAAATDLPARHAVIAPPFLPPPTWTGLYGGVHFGSVVDDSRIGFSPSGAFRRPAFLANNPLRSASFPEGRSNITGGGQVGYNFQVERFVLGLETDFAGATSSGLTFKNALPVPLAGTLSGTTNNGTDYYGTARARIGAVFGDALVYGTGGLAYGRVHTDTNLVLSSPGGNYVGSLTRVEVGYAVGGGIEYRLMPGVTVRGEYLRVDLGRVRSTGFPTLGLPGLFTYDTRRDTAFDVARLAVNYSFTGP